MSRDSKFHAGAAFAAVLAALLLAPATAGATDLFNNLSAPTGGFYSGLSSTVYLAMQVTAGASGFNVTSVTLKLNLNGTNSMPAVRVCPDNGGVPASAGCSTFTTTAPTTGTTMQNYTFTGAYAAAASAPLWVAVESSVVSGGFPPTPTPQWAAANSGTATVAVSNNGGGSWSAHAGHPQIMQVSGTVPAAPVPAMPWWAMLAVTLGVLGFGAVGTRRREG
jgi:hypothetical protein